MGENERLFKHFLKPNLESQVLDIVKKNAVKTVENNVDVVSSVELLIVSEKQDVESAKEVKEVNKSNKINQKNIKKTKKGKTNK